MLLHKQTLLQLDMAIEAAYKTTQTTSTTAPNTEEIRRKNIELSQLMLKTKHKLQCRKTEVEGLRLERKFLKEQLQGIEERHIDEVRSPIFAA